MAANITLENEKKLNDLEDGLGCQLCLEKEAKYTCPRCCVKYCSLACYKGDKHLKCSEEFYKNWCIQSLQNENIDKKGKEKMIEILKRQHEEQVEEVEDYTDDLEERLEGINLDVDSEKIWSKLTEAEKQEFKRAIDTGYIGSLLDPWIPWWIGKDQSSNEKILERNSLPKLLKNMPSIQDMLKTKAPSSSSRYNLINILYSYAYICRFYNGSHRDFIQEAIEGIWKLSAVFYHTVNFTSVESAIRSCVEMTQQNQKYYSSFEFSISVIKDVSLLLRDSTSDETGTMFVELALSDMYRLFSKGIKSYKMCAKNRDSQVIKALWLAKKKVYFMLAWFHENSDECLDLEQFLPIISEAIKLEFEQHNNEKTIIEQSRLHGSLSKKKLIEEI